MTWGLTTCKYMIMWMFSKILSFMYLNSMFGCNQSQQLLYYTQYLRNTYLIVHLIHFLAFFNLNKNLVWILRGILSGTEIW